MERREKLQSFGEKILGYQLILECPFPSAVEEHLPPKGPKGHPSRNGKTTGFVFHL